MLNTKLYYKELTKMDCTVLLLLFLTTKTITASTTATDSTNIETTPHHYCKPDEHSAASGMDDVQQPTTLQYCLIDNCTIMRIDTGQQLDIVYTTQSHIIVTTTNGQTSLLIPKNEPELSCFTNDTNIVQIVPLTIAILTGLVSGHIAGVILIFKELHNTFGKLMFFYNIALISECVQIAAIITHYKLPVHCCYFLAFILMQSVTALEAFTTCISAYLAYIMQQCYKRREFTKALDKKFYKYSIIYVLGLLLLFDIFIVGYDFGTGTYKHVISPNGHCTYFDRPGYNALGTAPHINIALNKTIQILLLLVYFVYYYKVNKMFKRIRNMEASTDMQFNRLFFKIGLTMGATIGVSKFLLVLSSFGGQKVILKITGISGFLIQQCVIMILFSKKILRLCKERFSTTKVSPEND